MFIHICKLTKSNCSRMLSVFVEYDCFILLNVKGK